jgi:hypothetical protein
MVKEIAVYKDIMRDFIEWNGWGPPTTEFQIQEYCYRQCYSEGDVDLTTNILTKWMNGLISLPQ